MKMDNVALSLIESKGSIKAVESKVGYSRLRSKRRLQAAYLLCESYGFVDHY